MELPEEKEQFSALDDIYQHFLHSAKSFKELVRKECNYSDATFYRKLVSRLGVGISRAEKKMIIEMAEYVVAKITESINRHK